MAKFAVLFVAALAFHATLAGVLTRPYQSQIYDDQVTQFEGYKTGKLQAYVAQIQTVANELSASFQYAQPNNMETLTRQSRELAQAVEQMLDRLQAQLNTHSGAAHPVLAQVFSELREIHASLQQTAGFLDISKSYQLQYQLSSYVQEIAHLIEKLVYYVQYSFPQAQGSLYATIQGVLADFFSAIQNIRTQAYPQTYEGGLYGPGVYQGEYYSQKYGKIGYPMGLFGFSGYKFHQAGKGLAIQLQVVASDLSAALQHVYVDNMVVRQTLMHLIRQYVQHLEIVAESLEQVSYTSGSDVMTQRLVAQNMRQMIVSLQQFVYSGVSINAIEMKNQLIMYVQNIASELKKLTYGVQPELEQLVGVKQALVRFLTATRYFYVQVQYISQVAHRGQTSTGFGYQIQTLANGLTAALESLSYDNKEVRQVLAEQSRELAKHIQTIIEKIQTVTYTTPYAANVPQQVASNLRTIVASLEQVADFENVASGQKLKMHLIANIQEAATEIQKLMWIGQQYLQQGQGEFYGTPVYGIFNDFVAALQNQQVQLYGMYQFSQYGQGTQQLSLQIQAITNNLAMFFQNVHFSGEHARQVQIQAHRLAYNMENIIQRLEVESMYTKEHVAFQQVVSHLRQMIASLEQVTTYGNASSVYEFMSHFNVVLQQIASEMRKLAYVAQYNGQYTMGNFNSVVRSVLIQYLNVIQHVQFQLQGISQMVHIGQTPRELALQIQVSAHRLAGMLQVVPDNRQTYGSFVYQARRLSQFFDIIVSKLQHQISAGNGQAFHVLQQVATNLKQIQMSLQQGITNVEAVSPYQLKIHLAARIQDAAVEIQKLVFVAPYEAQQIQGGLYAIVKDVLIEFLAGLHNLQMQVQDKLQIVLHGQNPRALAIQIESVAQRLFGYLQMYVQPQSQQMRQILVIQIGQLAQTIEHVVQMLQTEIKHSAENSVVLKQVVAHLNEISLALQQVNGFESHSAIEMSNQLFMYIQKIVAEFHKLAYVAQYKIQETQVGTYETGVLNGVFNSVLASLRNMYIQMQNVRYMGYYGHGNQQLATQIQTITNNFVETLHLVSPTSKTVKQALAIQTFRYARHIKNIVERLESEISYRSEMNGSTIQEIVEHLKQVVVALQQIAGTWTTSTTLDLKTQLIAQIQHADAQIQKLVVAQTMVPHYQGYASTIVKSVLIEYFAAVQNFNIRVNTIAKVSQKGQTVYQLAIRIETAAIELSAFFHHVLPSNRLVAQTMVLEARQLSKVIATIIERFHTFSGVQSYGLIQQIVNQLRQVQFSLQQIAEVQSVADVHQQKIHLEVNIHRAVVAIQQLIWAAQPEFEQVQVSTGVYTLVREALKDFLAAVQNVHLQIQNVIQNGQTRQFSWGWGFQGQQQGVEYPEQYYAGWRMFMQYPGQDRLVGSQYFGGMEMLHGEMAQSPRQYLFLIQKVVRELTATFQSSALKTQEAKQIITMQVRQFAQIIETIVNQMEQQFSIGSDNVTMMKQIIYQLREVQQSLMKIVGYTTFTNAYQLKTELVSYIQTVAAQMEQLVYVAQQVPQGHLYVMIKNVLDIFLNGVQQVQMQLQGIAQYSQYGYAGKFDQYDSQYGYAGQIRPLGYGFSGKYDQYDSEYGFAGQYLPYGHGLVGKYDQFDSEYGFSGQYRPYVYGYGLVDKYNLYDDEYAYAGLYRPYGHGNTGLSRPYGLGYSNQYDSEYTSQYGLFGNEYGMKYGYQGLPARQLAKQAEIMAQQIAVQFQTVAVDSQMFRQITIRQARQLVQVIDNIIDRLQVQVSGYGSSAMTFQQVISSLREIQTELQQIVSSGVLTTVHQIKAQFATYLERVASKLHQLAMIADADVKIQDTLVSTIIAQYLAYLRNVQYQMQGNTMGQSWDTFTKYGGAYDYTNAFGGELFTPSYMKDSMRGSMLDSMQGSMLDSMRGF